MVEEALERPETIDNSISKRTRKEVIKNITQLIDNLTYQPSNPSWLFNKEKGVITKTHYIHEHHTLIDCDTARGTEILYDKMQKAQVITSRIRYNKETVYDEMQKPHILTHITIDNKNETNR